MILRLLYYLSYPVQLLSGRLFRRRHVWVLGSIGGGGFAGNARELYLYLVKETDLSIYWVSKDRAVLSQMEELGLQCMYAYSIKGFWVGLQAAVTCITHTVFDVNEFCTHGSHVVYLSHGAYLKTMGFDESTSSAGRFSRRARSMFLPKYEAVVTTSETFGNSARSAFEPRGVWVTGFPVTTCYSGVGMMPWFRSCAKNSQNAMWYCSCPRIVSG